QTLFSSLSELIDCPIKVYFTIDTSETIALQESPPGSLVESIKEFTKIFTEKLADEEYRGQIQITWSIGGLHFSQTQKVFSHFTTRENFIRSLSRIRYLGKGTYIDCALRNMTQQVTQHYYSGPKAALFSVVITDGHVTGSPCMGIKMMADRARDQGIHIFSVAASRSIDELGMRDIASSPTEVYRDNYIVMEVVGGKPRLSTESIDQIIKVMKYQAYLQCYKPTCLAVPGIPGRKGSSGPKGAKGDRGKTGQKGEKGRQGDPGIEGPIGRPGLKVVSADVTQIHFGNFQGKMGRIGVPGCKGDLGDKVRWIFFIQKYFYIMFIVPVFDAKLNKIITIGYMGDMHSFEKGLACFELMQLFNPQQGTAGHPGDPGPRGDPGSLGPKGDKGRTGFGYPGPRGPSGSTGERGNKGPRGSRGECGAKGEPGDNGPEGEPSLSCVCAGWSGTHRRSWAHCIQSVYCEKHCGALDIVFVIDSSESVGLMNFTLEKNFVINTINRMGSMASDPASPTGTRVGVVQFSHEGTFEAIRLDDPTITSISAFKMAVKNLQWIAGGTFTPSALRFAYDNLIKGSKRSRAKISVVVVTDGRFDPRDDDNQLRYLCNDPDVTVNAIGVGDMFDKRHDSETLVSIACNNKSRITEMKQYTDLVAEDFIEKMETVLCPDPVIKCPDLPCKTELDVAPCVGRPVDLVILLDGSERLGMENFNQVRNFVESVTHKLAMAKGKNDRNWARLALIQFGKEEENQVAFPLTHDRDAIASGLASLTYLDSSSAVGPAIIYTINNLVGKGSTRKTRRGAEVSFVFVTDGVTNGTILDEAVSAMHREQIVSTVIATGSDVDQEVLTKLAMDNQEAIFKVQKFSDVLQTRMFNRFIRWVC
uniref:Collagen alpha-2(VI) chain n=1 Tax=Kryptolebias marmoratus TaxID=37003 RepID=A0A3Q3AHB2_KRYMA